MEFYNKAAVCPKCGQLEHTLAFAVANRSESEHLKRRCCACGFVEQMMPLDALPCDHCELVEESQAACEDCEHVGVWQDQPNKPSAQTPAVQI